MVDFYRKNTVRAAWLLVILGIAIMASSIVRVSAQNNDVLKLKVFITNPDSKWQKLVFDELIRLIEEHRTTTQLVETSYTPGYEPYISMTGIEDSITFGIIYPSPSEIIDIRWRYEIHENEVPRLVEPVIMSVLLFASGRCDEIEPYFAVLEENIPSTRADLLRAYIAEGRANCEIIKGDFEAAIRSYEALRIADTGKIHAEYRINLAWLYAQTNHKKQAAKAVNEYVDIMSDYGVAWIGYIYRARLYALMFDYASALEEVDTTIQLIETTSPEDAIFPVEHHAELYSIRGQIHLLLYEWENARDDFNQAIEFDDEYPDAYFYRGVLHSTLIERENALSDFEQYLVLAPDGRYAEETARYIDSIKIEIEASGD